jgi:NADH-quinone oxidoreductase subunit F
VFEADDRPGGMLVSGIPSFRLPREVLGKEIDALIAGGISVQCNKSLGRDITTEGLFDDGFKAVFIAIGAHDSRKLGLEGEECEGMHYAMSFLKAFNLRGQQLARGRVAVIGGGNSAVDAARVAIRQEAVESVTILYRRTREEMPAFEEEIEAALTEGIELQTLVSPVRISTDKGTIAGVKMIRNSLGDRGPDGRRRPVPISGSETELPFDTVIVAISERPGTSCLANTKSQPLEIMANGQLRTEPATLMTARPGVFAGGDVATGPNTVIDAIAAGKKAAVMIRRYLEGEQLDQPGVIKLPEAYVEPALLSEDELVTADRVEIPELDAASRHHNHSEVELSLSAGDATREARRCLRCDLEFTRPKAEKTPRPAVAREN